MAPLLIAMSGLPGTGKSTLAEGLAQRLRGVWVRIDTIEQAIRDSDVLAGDVGPAGYIVGYGIAEANLRLGHVVVADSVNPLAITRDAWRYVARRAGARLLEVEVVCSDPAEHRRRVETRTITVAGLVGPTWADVVGRERDAWVRAPVMVDTAGRRIDACVEQVVAAVARGLPQADRMGHHPGQAPEETAMWQESDRYPDPRVVAMDPSFNRFRVLGSVERLYTGCRWAEGPVWFGDQRAVFWSDIPNNRILRWDEETGQTSVFRKPSNNANGNTRDRQGRLVTCEHDSRRVTRTEYDGSITVLADSYQGKKLNSPNDVVVSSDGSVWFTDPQFGILGFYEGHKDESEIAPAVWRIDGRTGALTMVADDIPGPNGLAFSPDESKLYVVASRADPREIRVYDVVGGSKLANGRVFINAAGGSPDGFRVDIEGNLWCGWGMGTEELDGVRVFNTAGAPIGHIRLPERAANLCFGGRHRNRLFMTASHSLYSLYANTQGAAGG